MHCMSAAETHAFIKQEGLLDVSLIKCEPCYSAGVLSIPKISNMSWKRVKPYQ